MDKQTLTREIQKQTGCGFACVSDIARFMGTSRERAANMMRRVDYYTDGRKKKYLVADVAEQILKNRQQA